MKTIVCHAIALLMLTLSAQAGTVNAIWNTATDVPVTASSYTAAGNTVNFTLNFAPEVGTELMVVKNTGLPFINGTFSNLAQGQDVPLTFGGAAYHFIANYFGGTGNDLVLTWSPTRPYAWGSNGDALGSGGVTTNGPVAVVTTGLLSNKTVLALSPGRGFSLAACSDGTAAAWGGNASGQLGNNSFPTSTNVPVAVTATGVLSNKMVVAISAGVFHGLAFCSDGTMAAWGDNSNGQLGDGTTTDRYVPVAVSTNSVLSNKTVVATAAGGYHNLVLCSDGTVVAWGANGSGQLGDGTTTDRYVPVAVNTTSNSALFGKTVAAIAAGHEFYLALCSDGTVAAWGDNGHGDLGDGTNIYSPLPVGVITTGVLSNKSVVAISASEWNSYALCSDGTVVAWGWDDHGSVGDGGHSDAFAPVAVDTSSRSALFNKTVVAISGVGNQAFAWCSDGTLAGWGSFAIGPVGSTTTTDTNLPVAIKTLSLPAGARITHVFREGEIDHSLALVALSVAPNVTGITRAGGGPVTSKFTGFPGGSYGVQASTNLTDWTVIGSQTADTNGLFQYIDSDAPSYDHRFYRAVPQ